MQTITRPRKVSHPRYKWTVTYKDGAKRKKKCFTRKVEAETFFDGQKQEILDHGT